MNRLSLFVLLAWFGIAGTLAAPAQPITTLYSFTKGPTNPRSGLVLAQDGNFYGTTEFGGGNFDGTVYRVATNGTVTTLVSFNGTDGSLPVGSLLAAPDGYLYGTTSAGGATLSGTNTTGTVFKMTTNGVLTTLVNFNGLTNGSLPQGPLALGPDGYLYGTTEFGGTNNDGTIFKMTTNGALTTLVTFNGTNGSNPQTGLALGPDGSFYGTAEYGGTNGTGTYFKVTTNGVFTLLLNFNGANGALPLGALTLGPDGNFYGTTSFGGNPNGDLTGGTVFRVTTNGVLTTMTHFSAFGTNDGGNPYAGVILGADGNFYGTTTTGGTNGTGTVYQLSTNGTLAMLVKAGIPYETFYNNFGTEFYSTNNGTNFAEVLNGTLTTVYNFPPLVNATNTTGADSEAQLILGADRGFYGTTYSGGTNGYGAVYRVTTNGVATAIAAFSGNQGIEAEAGLTVGTDGVLYGTAQAGGVGNYGIIYGITPGGSYGTVVNFNYYADGASPVADLTPGPNGTFYGTAQGGGTNLLSLGGNNYDTASDGTVFQVTTNGMLTALVDFDGTNGANPTGAVIVGPGGDLYGTTANGGTNDDGTVFQLATNGTLTVLVNFDGTNGANPAAGLTLGPDGNFYGTTFAGGTSSNGTVFQVTVGGILTVLHNFSALTMTNYSATNVDGGSPDAALTLGPDGNLYGSTFNGGIYGYGTLFRITTGGILTTLVNFAQTNGEYPVGSLMVGPDGNFYGTTELGGSVYGGEGTIFRLTTNGLLTTLAAFTGPNGSFPAANLTLATNNNFIHFYGTTTGGGSGTAGTIFQFDPKANYAVAENTTDTFNALTNDTAFSTAGGLALVSVGATNGTAAINGTNIVFTPAQNFIGTATINYEIKDSLGDTDAELISVLVTNVPPVATPQGVTTPEDTAKMITLGGVDANQLPLTFAIVSGPVHGTLSNFNTNSGAVTYTPNANYSGADSFTFQVSDGQAASAPATVNITVTAVVVTNAPPVANPDFYAITENTLATFSPLANDQNLAPGGMLSLVSVSSTNGTAAISGTNVLFTPAMNFIGTATIGYTITDNVGDSNSSLITVTVTNIPPVANPSSYTVTENSTNTFSPLVTDRPQTPGGTLTLTGVSATNGTAMVSGTNIVFTPTLNFTGTATITYFISDGIGGSNSALLTIAVTNIPPVVNPASFAVTENSTNTFSPLGNDHAQTPGGTLILTSVSPTNGTASISGTNIIFAPTSNFLGVATIRYTASDSIGGSNSALITVTVTNIPPAVTPGVYSITENTTNTLNVLTNDQVQIHGGILGLVAATTTNGSVTIGGGTNLIFLPGTNYLGALVIHYTITDTVGGTNSSTVTVTVTNLPPIANPDTYSVAANTTNIFSPLANDQVLTPGGTLSLVSVSPTNGTAVINGTNVLFTPAVNFLGTATIGYSITDSIGGTNSSLITVTVTNRPPLATAQTVYTAYNTAVGITLSGSDANSTPVTFTILSSPLHGALSGVNTNSGALTYTPASGFSGQDSFTFAVSDGFTSSAPATVTINVGAQNAADILVLATGPANAALGSNFVYSILVTNAGPSTASNIVAEDVLPASFHFISTSGGGIFATNTVTWPPVPLLVAGAETNYTITVSSTVGGSFTNIARETSASFDPSLTNNNGTSPASQVVTAVSFAQFAEREGSPVFNPQDGLYEEIVTVTNTGAGTVAGFQVYATGLPAHVYLWNATGTNAGVPYVQYGYPLNPSNFVALTLQFYDPSGATFTNQISVIPVIPTAPGNAGTNSAVAAGAIFQETSGGVTHVVVEFSSVPGQTYAVLYSSDLITWQVATPSITASANITQWIDEGPPGTQSAPQSVRARFYRIIRY